MKVTFRHLIIACVIVLGTWGINEYIKTRKVVTLESGTSFDDKRKVVGAADNVFVGRVIEQRGTRSSSSMPETQFSVEVLSNIKGKLIGRVTLNQQGGYFMEHGKKTLRLLEGENLLQQGKTYLFLTRYSESGDWNTIIPVLGGIPIDTDLRQTQLIEEYNIAYENQIVTEAVKILQ